MGTGSQGLAVEAGAVDQGEFSYLASLAHLHEIGVNLDRLFFSEGMVKYLYFQKNR